MSLLIKLRFSHSGRGDLSSPTLAEVTLVLPLWQRWPQPILAILFRPFGFIAPINLNHLAFHSFNFSASDEAYSRNMCTKSDIYVSITIIIDYYITFAMFVLDGIIQRLSYRTEVFSERWDMDRGMIPRNDMENAI